MAILKGFPPSNTISPSVRITEQDLTFLAETPSLQRIGLVGFASKGPINTPTEVTSLSDLQTKFGNPHPDSANPPYLIYAAQLALQISNSVFIVRCGETNPTSPNYAETGEVQVPAAGNLISVIGSGVFDANDTISFPDSVFFRWRLNGVLSSKVLVLLADSLRPDPNTGNPYTLQDVVDELNAQLDFQLDGIWFYVDGTTNVSLKLETTWAYGPDASLEIVSTLYNMLGGPVSSTGATPAFTNVNNIFGLATANTQASVTSTNDHYPDDGYTDPGKFVFTTGDVTLAVALDGTGNVSFDKVIQVLDLNALKSLPAGYATASDIATEINAQITANPTTLGGFTASDSGNFVILTTDAYGVDAKLTVKASGTLAAALGFPTTLNTGSSTKGASDSLTADTYGIITGPAAAATDYTFLVKADTPGSESDNTFVVFTNDDSGGTFTCDVYVQNPLTLNIVQVESWGNLTKNSSSQFYVESYLNTMSNYIRVVDNTVMGAPPSNSPTTGSLRLFLSGGTDGAPPITDPEARDALLIGSPTNLSGLYAFSEPEQTDIDIVAVPGGTSTDVILSLINLCEVYRQDCLAIVDPPAGLTPTEIIQWQNGRSGLNTIQFDTDFAALYWPWVVMRDTYNAIDVTVPPSGAVCATIARSDSISWPWYAPAGLTRGVVPGILGVAAQPTLAEKDAMYGNGNAINPIVKYVGVDSFLVWGQKTLQRRPSALDRVNVRRMMFYIEKQIRNLSRTLLFDPHTEALRAKFVNLCSGVLNNVVANSGIYAFRIKCDEELNPPDVVDRNELRARIGVQPVRAAEFIFIEFSLHRTGSFTESTAVVV